GSHCSKPVKYWCSSASRRFVAQEKKKLEKKGGSWHLTSETSEAFRERPVLRDCSYEVVNWAYKKSPALKPMKCQYSPTVAGLAWVKDWKNVGVVPKGYMFSTDNCPDLRLDCISRVALYGWPHELPVVQMSASNASPYVNLILRILFLSLG
ncbi:hypothetical protein HAX54_033993, partial [Datura stramonium]|nr:hypothetical protein [Datura stramonium]